MITLAIGLMSLAVSVSLLIIGMVLSRIAKALEDANHLTRQYYNQDYHGEQDE